MRVTSDAVFTRTKKGQMIYDVLFSHMSAVEVAKRHKLKREDVLRYRRTYPQFRPKTRGRGA